MMSWAVITPHAYAAKRKQQGAVHGRDVESGLGTKIKAALLLFKASSTGPSYLRG